MNEINIAKLDLNLLKSLNALVNERHVGRAADVMNVSQSAMSHSLARLRRVFNDKLFIRTSKGIEPTQRTLQLIGPLNTVLAGIDKLLIPKAFDLQKAEVKLTIQTHDFILSTFFPELINRVRKSAPNMTLDIGYINSTSYRDLDQGTVDFLIGSGLKATPKLLQRKLTEEPIVCVMDSNHPLVDSLDETTVFDYPHIKFKLLSERDDPVSAYAASKDDLCRKVRLNTESLGIQIHQIAGTDLIAFLPLSIAKQGALQYGLHIEASPFDLVDVPVLAIWHERQQNNPLHQWFREQLVEVFEQ